MPTGSTVRAWWWRELRPLLLRVHFYAGLFVGPFLLIAALTGLLYTTTPQLEQLVHRDELHVSVPAGAAVLPLSAQIAAASAALPEGSLKESGHRSAGRDHPGDLQRPRVPEDYSRTVFIDPYTAQVRGTLTTLASGSRCAPGSTSCTAPCCSATSDGCTASSRPAGCGCSHSAAW